MEKAAVEDVLLREDDDLECEDDGIEAEVRYKVSPLEGAQGNLVKVWVTANGEIIGKDSGPLYSSVNVEVFIPAPDGVTPACYDDD